MMDLAQLASLIASVPEHPVPAPGQVARLDYPARFGGVAVQVETAANGTAHLTVTASSEEAVRSVEAARNALVRSLGEDPADAQGLERARARVGMVAFAEEVNQLARQRLFALAVMRTGILPFLAPRYLDRSVPRPGESYRFEVEVLLRPQAELESYDAVALPFPERAPITDDDIERAMGALLGGPIRMASVPDEARASFGRLREEARQQLEAQQDAAHTEALIDRATDALIARLEAEPPQAYVELLRNQMANQFAASVEASGTSWDAYTADPTYSEEAFRERMTQEALQSLRRGMVLDAVAAHEGITLTLDDVLAALGPVARGQETTAAQAMLDSGRLPQLCEVARRAKAGEWIARHAVDAAVQAGENPRDERDGHQGVSPMDEGAVASEPEMH